METLKSAADLLKDPAVMHIVVILAKCLLAWYVLAAAIGALQMPQPGDPRWYKWLFAALNGFAANVHRALKALKVPGEGD